MQGDVCSWGMLTRRSASFFLKEKKKLRVAEIQLEPGQTGNTIFILSWCVLCIPKITPLKSEFAPESACSWRNMCVHFIIMSSTGFPGGPCLGACAPPIYHPTCSSASPLSPPPTATSPMIVWGMPCCWSLAVVPCSSVYLKGGVPGSPLAWPHSTLPIHGEKKHGEANWLCHVLFLHLLEEWRMVKPPYIGCSRHHFGATAVLVWCWW